MKPVAPMSTLDAGRKWAVREAVLKWVYNEKLHGRRMPVLNAAAVGVSVRWPMVSPLTDAEVAVASTWLWRAGLVDSAVVPIPGQPDSAVISRPRLTELGAEVARSAVCVRGVPDPDELEPPQ